MILFAISVDHMRQQQDRKLVVRARVMSSAMTRNGLSMLLVSLVETVRRESARMEQKQQALKQPSI
uniref:Uncharacterized protein n=1 Tax=Brassica oleracea TaxID=3712 RepID=A0A3P6EWB5_BRAOL|nr:unnamed protein product [Brassica oleracea]